MADDWADKQVTNALETAVEAYRYGLLADIAWAEEQCESPIERVMAAWLYSELTFSFGMHDLTVFVGPREERRWPEPYNYNGAGLYCQAPIDRYRVDFLLFARIADKHSWLVVECDGHDYHERTKEQARRDRSRDRWMTLNGLKVLRFTGQEIYENPQECASQAVEALEAGLNG